MSNKDFENTKYLILGSTGMLGQALVRILKEKGNEVVGIARKNADISFDTTNEKLLLDAIKQTNPQIIINTVAIVNLSYCEEHKNEAYALNARISATLAKESEKLNIKYVYISTDHYYTNNNNNKHNEDSALNLCNEYAITKYKGEILSLINQNALVVRTNIVGFRYNNEKPTFVEWIIESLKKDKKIDIFNDFFTSSIDVGSLSKALLDLINKDVCGIINLASRTVSSKEEFILALAKRLNLSTKNTTVCSISTTISKVQRNESLGLDVLKAEEILGYKLPTLANVIDNLAKEFLNKGKIVHENK